MALKAFIGAARALTRAEEAGYDVDDVLCPLCGAAPDTIDHRIFDCPAADHVRTEHNAALVITRAKGRMSRC